MRGGDLYDDPNLEDTQEEENIPEFSLVSLNPSKYHAPSGNHPENINMWRETCEMIAQNTDNNHEKAIYSLLSRDLELYKKTKVYNKNYDGTCTW